MTLLDFRARQLRAFWVPADEGKPMELLELSVGELMKKANINFFERVNTQHGHDNHFVMVVDEDGRDRRLPYNPRAQYFSGYPVHAPIVGDALFVSEDWVDDGIEFVSLTDKGLAYLQDPVKQEIDGYPTWRAAHDAYILEYTMHYPI